MNIIYLGHSSFLLKFKLARVVCDPYSEAVGFKMAKTKADIVTISHQHDDHNNFKVIGGEPRVVNGPGEYEIKGVIITGITTYHDNSNGKEKGKNIVYTFDSENLRLCHLGDLGHELSEKQLNKLNGVDILFVNVGGETSNGPKKAVKVIKQIKPSIVIPMHYKTKEHNSKWENKASLKDFIDEIQLEPRREEKLKINKLDLPEELQLVVLERYAK